MISSNIKVLLAGCMLLTFFCMEVVGQNVEGSIINGTDWYDVEGRPIMAHEGDIARFNGYFYWYGSSYENNPTGKFDIADGPVWNGVQCYRSTDLKNWTFMGVCLPRPENGWGELGATGRSHVLYNEKTKKYVMWYRWYLHVPASFLMVAVADRPEGPFTSLGPREMGTSNGFASDMNVFKDDDGKAYVIYCDHGEHGVTGSKSLYAIRIDGLSDDYLSSNQDGAIVFEKGCEAPAMVKYKGKYIAIASGVHGWAGTETVCAVADSPLGTYERQEDISENKTWNSQVTDLIYLKESDRVMALCDQWWVPDKTDLNKSRYLFLPLDFDPETGKVKMEYHEKWDPLKAEHSFEGNFDWKEHMVVAERKRDASGLLLPLQSYEETILRGMSFLLEDHLEWFGGQDESLRDEKGKMQMPWVYYSNIQHNGEPFPASIDRFVSYPAFHHSLMISTFIKFWKYRGDQQALAQAMQLADWNIAHSTPDHWAYGNMPYSTFEEKKPGGFRDKSGIMPDKGAIMALAYLDLYKASEETRFLEAAEAIAQTLAGNQRTNGTWPFRVDPETEEVIEEFTSSVIYAIRLFEALDEINRNEKYRAHRDLTWDWLLNGPIRTKEFRGFYEDIPESTEGRTNYDCLDVIRYLLNNRTENNGYLEMALELNAWVEKVFKDPIKGFEPAEGIREQLQCNVVMGIHSLNWASMLKELAEASGNDKMRERAMQTANYVTYYLQPDNRIVVGFEYNQWWYSCHIGVICYLFDFLEEGDG